MIFAVWQTTLSQFLQIMENDMLNIRTQNIQISCIESAFLRNSAKKDTRQGDFLAWYLHSSAFMTVSIY